MKKLVILLFAITLLISCDEEDSPTEPQGLSTITVTDITQNTATSGGNISNDGGSPITARGVCWSTNPSPTTADSKTSNETGTGSFTSNLSDLTAGTTYYLRAYATNSEGTAYGNQEEFTTEAIVTTIEDIREIATFQGNPDGDIVIVNTQGGPLIALADERLNEYITRAGAQSALVLNVHQEQTKNPPLFTAEDITFEQAKQYDIESVSTLKRVVDFYRIQEDKTVYVLGISFGAFMIQELIATYGTDIAEGYLIMVGRLDIDEDTWQPFSQGEFTEYLYDDNGNYTISLLGEGSDVEERNMARLAAGLGYNRYTEKLSSIDDLSKVTYVYGGTDQQVGPLSAQEIQFLEEKGADVVFSEGDHGDGIDVGISLLKETFGIQ